MSNNVRRHIHLYFLKTEAKYAYRTWILGLEVQVQNIGFPSSYPLVKFDPNRELNSRIKYQSPVEVYEELDKVKS